jgi:cytochrome c
MKQAAKFIGILALVACAFTAKAEPPEVAKSLLDAAVAELKTKGTDGAVKEFNGGGKWRSATMYVVVADFKGNMLAHSANEKFIGKNVFEAKDAAGKPFVQEVIKGVQASGQTQVDLRWANPATKKIDDGQMFAKRVPGQDLYVGTVVFK